MMSFSPNFSHIYVEKDAYGYHLTDLAISKFQKSSVIEVNHYKDIFNRSKQDFQVQKRAMKLILAKKTDPFIYNSSYMVQEYGTPNTYYNTPLLNCLYNCDYCFLQGMYDSGNMVLFVNEKDFMDAIDQRLLKPKDPANKTVVSISYNTDLLAMENIFPLTRNWINYAKNKKNLIIEIRTKSALFSSIKDMRPNDSIILSWTLSPQIICDKYESSAPPLSNRLKAAKEAIDMGWTVRLCFDPILIIKGWRVHYSELLNMIFKEINGESLRDITFGVFRMNKDYFKRVRKREPDSDIFYRNYKLENNFFTENKINRIYAMDYLKRVASKYISNEKILTWN